MSNIVEEYAYQITVKGSKVAIQAFDKVANASKKLGEVDKQNLSATEKQTKAITKQSSALWLLAKRLLGVYSVYALFKKGLNLAVNFAETGTAISNMATVAGVSAKQLQKWGYIFKKYGLGDEKTAGAVLGSLESKLLKARYNDYSAFEKYMEFGGKFSPSSTPEQFLKGLAKQARSMPQDRARLMIESLGLESLLPLLLDKNIDIDKELANAKVLFTDGDIAKAKEAKEKLAEFNHEIEKLGIAIGGIVLDPLIKVVEVLRKFLESDGAKLGAKIYDFMFNPEHTYGEGEYDLNNPNGTLRKGLVGFWKDRYNQFRTNPLSLLPTLPSIAPLSNLLGALNSNFDQTNNIVINGANSAEVTGKSVVNAISGFSADNILYRNFAGLIRKDK